MNSPKPHLLGVVAGLFLAGGLVASASLLTRAWLKVADAESISVAGSARRNISSDLVVWRGTLTVDGDTLLQAQSELQTKTSAIETFLKSHNITNAQYQPIAISRILGRTGTGDDAQTVTVGFRLNRAVEVRSMEIDTVLAMDSAITTLIQGGIEFAASTPEFIWTKAGEAKIEMLADAAKDARARADQIASQGGRSISRMRSARMGVFQITPIYSTQNSWDGMNDTTSREKTVTAVVNASFALN